MISSPFVLASAPRPTLPPDLVVGHIRWNRALGTPQTDPGLAKPILIFNLSCYHWENPTTGQGGPFVEFRSGHPVDAWAGPHDATYFRVSFMTTAQAPHKPGVDPRKYLHNFLDASFQTGVQWGGRKVISPAQTRFDLPRVSQLLPELEVFAAP